MRSTRAASTTVKKSGLDTTAPLSHVSYAGSRPRKRNGRAKKFGLVAPRPDQLARRGRPSPLVDSCAKLHVPATGRLRRRPTEGLPERQSAGFSARPSLGGPHHAGSCRQKGTPLLPGPPRRSRPENP